MGMKNYESNPLLMRKRKKKRKSPSNSKRREGEYAAKTFIGEKKGEAPGSNLSG